MKVHALCMQPLDECVCGLDDDDEPGTGIPTPETGIAAEDETP